MEDENERLIAKSPKLKTMEDFINLQIWQNGIDIVKDVYKLTSESPKEEKYRKKPNK